MFLVEKFARFSFSVYFCSMNKLGYRLLKTIVYAVSLLPFWVLYGMSDIVFFPVYYIFRYRRKVVRSNLVSSFPDMPEKDLKRVERRFYHWLCDFAVEAVKLLSMSDKKMLRHVEYRNVEEMEKFFDEGRNCSVMSGHYCNWEWYGGLLLAMKRHRQAVLGMIYHPLYNDAFDRLFIDIRSAHGATCIPKRDILRRLVTYKQEGRRSVMSYANDQSPKWENMHLWLDFLNHDTPVFTGGERIMRKMNDAVFFADIQRPRRGHYTVTLKLITAEAAKEEEFFITRRSFEMLEENIRREPAYYLWTHKRWKRTHEEFDRQFVIVNGKVIPRKKESEE